MTIFRFRLCRELMFCAGLTLLLGGCGKSVEQERWERAEAIAKKTEAEMQRIESEKFSPSRVMATPPLQDLGASSIPVLSPSKVDFQKSLDDYERDRMKRRLDYLEDKERQADLDRMLEK